MSILKLILLAAMGLVLSACAAEFQFSKGDSEVVYLTELENHPKPLVAVNKAGGCICHIPPGNPAKAKTICVGMPAIPHHIEHHGDYLGECRDDVNVPPVEFTPPPVEATPPPVEPTPGPVEPPIEVF